MRRSLEGRHVVITGGAGGIGAALARRLVERRCARIVLVDRDEVRLARVTSEVVALSASTRVESHATDLTRPEAVSRLVSALAVEPVDILVNNAGIVLTGSFVEMKLEHIEAVLELDLMATVRLTRLLLPGLCQRPWACVVNVASAAGLVAPGGLSAYSAAKFGLVGFSEALRSELSARGVDVVAVCPAFTRTEILRNSNHATARAHAGSEALEALVARVGASPQRLASRICVAIERGEAVVATPPWVRAALGLKHHAPHFARWLGAWTYQQLLRRAILS